jgi:hypothetical protein
MDHSYVRTNVIHNRHHHPINHHHTNISVHFPTNDKRFLKLGTTQDGFHIIYTSIDHIKTGLDTNDTINLCNNVLKQLNNEKWIWVVNCKNIKVTTNMNIDFALKMIKLLKGDYISKMQCAFLIQAPKMINIIFDMLSPFVEKGAFDHVKLIKGSILEVYTSLEKNAKTPPQISKLLADDSYYN